MNRTSYFGLLRRIKEQYETETDSKLKPSSYDHFMNFCEMKYGFRPYMNFAGFTTDYQVVDDAKFNWFLLQFF